MKISPVSLCIYVLGGISLALALSTHDVHAAAWILIALIATARHDF